MDQQLLVYKIDTLYLGTLLSSLIINPIQGFMLWQPLITKTNDHTNSKSLSWISSEEFIRELDKEPLLYYPLYIYIAPGLCYNNINLSLCLCIVLMSYYSSTCVFLKVTMLLTCALISYF